MTTTDLVRGSRTENLAEIAIAIADTDGSAVVARGGNESDGEIAVMIVVGIGIAVIAETTMIGLVVGIKIGIGILEIVSLVAIGIGLGPGITIVPTEDDLVRARETVLIAKMMDILNIDEQIAVTPPPSDELMLSDAETECTNDITTTMLTQFNSFDTNFIKTALGAWDLKFTQIYVNTNQT